MSDPTLVKLNKHRACRVNIKTEGVNYIIVYI